MKFIHAADLHLDSPLQGLARYEGAPVETIRGATRRAFENLVNLAMEEAVAFVLLAGDLYDGDWKDYNTGLFFARQMARLQDAGIRVFAIAGNHDAASQITRVLRLPKNVHVFPTRAPDTVVLEEHDVAVHGQGFATRAVTEDLSRAYPSARSDRFNIGLLHTSLNGRPGHEPYAPCSAEGLRACGYQYWALGHVHQHEVVAREPWIVFPGNTQGRHARETGAKGCALVTVEDGEVVELRHVALDVVRWAACPVNVTDAVTLDEVYDRVGRALGEAGDAAEGRPLAVRLHLFGTCPVHGKLRAAREQVAADCRAVAVTAGGGDLWVEKVLVDSREPESEAPVFAPDEAFGGLLRAIRELEADGEALSRLAAEIDDLNLKLPPALRSGEDALNLTDPAFLREILEDVKALLIERLLTTGGPW